ncbi:MAG: hypothetical protein GYB36_11660 [Alphaproteobacteria bacterium]|nr:hypothetical protein [Alphaproteobacteria bacterium]
MSITPIGKTPDRLWLCMADSNRTRILSRALAKGLDMTVYLGPTMDQEGPVAIIVADDAHAKRIAEAKTNAAPAQRSILVTAGGRVSQKADLYISADVDAGGLVSAISGLRAFREQELVFAKAVDASIGAVTSLSDAEFRVRTLEDARDLAVFLARIAPKPCATAVGIYVLLASAIEHGNLEFTVEEKAQALAEGKWDAKLNKRLSDARYADRSVKIRFQRGQRLMSFLIQDDGEGIDAETAEMANPTRTGFRGRAIKLAKSLGFGTVNYLGVGNTVEASMTVGDVTPRQSVAVGGR